VVLYVYNLCNPDLSTAKGKHMMDVHKTPDFLKHVSIRADRTLDLGEKGCSHLLQDIADSFSAMSSGQTLLVLANDPAAPLDIKVWSKQTGNTLLQSDLASGCFLLQKK
jgi:TusA-related sulfurtransferase